MTDVPRVSALITNYETWELTLRCLEALEIHRSTSLCEVVIVDDCSSSPPPQALEGRARLLRNPTNLGYARSVNLGVAAACGELILLLDSDAYPLMDLATPLVELFRSRSRLGAVGFELTDEGGRPTGSRAGQPTALGFLLGQRLEERLGLHGRGPLTLFSCALGLRRVAFLEVGGMDEGFDFLDADVDLSMRLRQAGWELLVERSLRAVHGGGGSPQTAARRIMRYHRNRWRLLVRHGLLPVPALWKLGLAGRHMAELVLLSAQALYRGGDRRDPRLIARLQLLRSVWSDYEVGV